jgi:predicted transposase YbfD/YdcC
VHDHHDRTNSRDVVRHLSALTVDPNDPRFSRFQDMHQIVAVVRERDEHRTNVNSTEIVYGITSREAKKASAAQLAGFTRGHWGIENDLHRRRDVTYGEDANRTSVGNSWHCLAVLRNLAISATNLLANGRRHARVRRTLAADLNQLMRAVGLKPVVPEKKL